MGPAGLDSPEELDIKNHTNHYFIFKNKEGGGVQWSPSITRERTIFLNHIIDYYFITEN